jgi:hypothetical protein
MKRQNPGFAPLPVPRWAKLAGGCAVGELYDEYGDEAEWAEDGEDVSEEEQDAGSARGGGAHRVSPLPR